MTRRWFWLRKEMAKRSLTGCETTLEESLLVPWKGGGEEAPGRGGGCGCRGGDGDVREKAMMIRSSCSRP